MSLLVRSHQFLFNMTKYCPKCNIEKEYPEDFSKNYRYNKDGSMQYSNTCKKCNLLYQQNFKKENKEKYNEQSRRYYRNNKEKCNAVSKEWRKNNIEKMRDWRAKNRKKLSLQARERYKKPETRARILNKLKYRTKHDLNFKIRGLMRATLVNLIKKGYKSNKTLEILGCSVEEFKLYIESKFLPGMTWENHGVYTLENPDRWHVDHIVPCSKFDLSNPEDQRKCFHYTNLQPLWGADNIKKSDSISI